MLNGGGSDDKIISAILQKSAYRALRSLIVHPAANFDPAKVLQIWTVLKDARQTCDGSALKSRFMAIQALLGVAEQCVVPRLSDPAVSQAYMQLLAAAVPEIMLHLREVSASVRESARECLHIIARSAIDGDQQSEFIPLVLAGLAGLSPHMRSSAVDALSRMLYEHGSRMAPEATTRLVNVVLVLLEDSDAQVFRSALKFCKVVVFVIPYDQLPQHVTKILRLFASRHMTTAKMLVRRIVEGLNRVLPPETLREAFPKDHLPLLQYVQRQHQRRKRARAMKAGGDENDGGEEGEDEDMGTPETGKKKKDWAEFQEGDDDDEDDEEEAKPVKAPAKSGKRSREEASGATAHVAVTGLMAHDSVQQLLDAWEAESDEEGASKVRPGRAKRKRGGADTSTWIREDGDVPLDFMSADAAHSVLTLRPPTKRRRAPEGAESRVDSLRRHGLTFAEDGRLVVAEEKETTEAKGAGFTLGTDSGSRRPAKALSQLAELRKKRKLALAEKRAERKGHIVKGLDNFKPGKKKASGDAQRKSGLEPFAYVALNPKITKERLKTKAVKSFQRVVKGAKAGVLKGQKARGRELKLRHAREVKKKKQEKRKRQPAQRNSR